MKNLNIKQFVEVKNKRYIIRPHEKNTIQKRNRIKPLGTEQQITEATTRQKQRNSNNKNTELEVKSYPKRKPNNNQKTDEQSKLDLESTHCKQRSIIEFNQLYYCRNCEFFVDEPKRRINEQNTETE